MKPIGRLLNLTFFCFVTIFLRTCSSDSPPPVGCALNFSSYSYQLTGEYCVGVQEKIADWDSFPKTLCCRNALTVFSQALAQHVYSTQGTIFPSKDMWSNCNASLSPEMYSAFVDSCGFNDYLFSGGLSQCATFSLAAVKSVKPYQFAVDECSNFENAIFDDACANCTPAILDVRKGLLKLSQEKDDNNSERAICGVAAVISVAAGESGNGLLIDNFYRCLPSLSLIYSSDSVVKPLFAILIAIITLMLIILLIKYVTKKKPHKAVQSKVNITTWSGLYTFSKAEIENALNFGNEKICLGRGSAGHVYKGVLPSGQVVAIKHINKSNISDSFKREVDNLSRVRHPNLVCLFGCCVEDGEQYLVYEYCPADNLAQHLLRKDTLLTWDIRVRILRDCALALRYLHHYIDGCIVHRDIKIHALLFLTNILLSDKLEPKLSDFGLARLLGMEETKVFTDVRGTIGYMDPEYMSNAKLTCASDIYSFGIVALQLLSGRKVIELDLDARDQLTRMARDVHMGNRLLSDFEDPRLGGDFNKADFKSILQIAVLCVANTSRGRPNIENVFGEMDTAWKNTDTYKTLGTVLKEQDLLQSIMD
ncbi:proline-rich receptor-like protein kinase PERK3 [Corylus avellana]|uniref:proline-rich receptor-like protein kinase PERK3 n=1 Tax=Corylus avellana TaxID=13451 RepID=UPI00286CBD66|nr:proline-rich receptor-like protein kinase PERK3 [Corylus avellana]